MSDRTVAAIPSNAVALLRCTPLMNQIRELKHNRINQLIEYNGRGTIQYMIKENVLKNMDLISTYSASVPMQIRHDGDDPLKTWSEYKDVINRYMREVVRKSELRFYEYVVDPAIQVLSKHFWDEYYKKYPRWPAVGATNVADIYINIAHCYRHPEDAPLHLIVWNCTGDVHVEDSRPDGNYRAHLSGSPYIKLVFVETTLLNRVEADLSRLSLEQAKAKVDGKEESEDEGVRQIVSKFLTWIPFNFK